jgi:hypothetical protein
MDGDRPDGPGEALRELGELSEDLGLYDATAGQSVCITHARFVPCRKQGGCVESSDPEDVEIVRREQVLRAYTQNCPNC